MILHLIVVYNTETKQSHSRGSKRLMVETNKRNIFISSCLRPERFIEVSVRPGQIQRFSEFPEVCLLEAASQSNALIQCFLGYSRSHM